MFPKGAGQIDPDRLLCTPCTRKRMGEETRIADPAEVAADWMSGMKVPEICKKHGFKTTKSVYDCLVKAGVDVAKGRPAGRKGSNFKKPCLDFPRQETQGEGP